MDIAAGADQTAGICVGIFFSFFNDERCPIHPMTFHSQGENGVRSVKGQKGRESRNEVLRCMIIPPVVGASLALWYMSAGNLFFKICPSTAWESVILGNMGYGKEKFHQAIAQRSPADRSTSLLITTQTFSSGLLYACLLSRGSLMAGVPTVSPRYLR